MMKKNMFLISTVLAISLLFSFSIENKAIAAETIKIGAVLPLADIAGKDASRSMQLAVKQINAAGGLLGRQVELVLVDDEGMPDKAVAAIEKLVNTNKVDVIVGGIGNAITMEIVPLLKRYQKITVWTGASSAKVDEALQGQNWFFHMQAWDYELGPYYEKIWREIEQKYPTVKKKVIFVAYREDPFGSDIYNASIPVAKAYLNPLKGEVYKEAADFPALLKNAVKFAPHIFIWDGSEKDAVPMLEAAKNYGFAPPVFLGKSVATWPADFGNQMGAEGVMFYGFWHESMKERNKPCLEYINAFNNEFKETPATYFGPLAYSNIMIVADAIKRAGSLEREILISTLASTKYETPLGDTISFYRSLGVTHQSAVYPKLFQWQGGSVKIIWPWELATGKLIYPFPAQGFNPPPAWEDEPMAEVKKTVAEAKPDVKPAKPVPAPVTRKAPVVAKPRPVAPAPAPAPIAVAPAPAPAPVAVAPAPAPAPRPYTDDVDMTGKWEVTVITPRGPGNPDFILKQDGNRLTGDYKGLFGETSVRGNVEGKKFVIRFSLGGVTSVYTGRVDGNKISGGVELSDGSEKLQGTFSGERTSAPPIARPRPVAPAPAPAPTPVAPAPAPISVAPAPAPAPIAVAPAPAPAPVAVAPAPAPAPRPYTDDVDMTGKWEVTVITPRGPGNPDFILKQDGNRLTGDYKGLFGETSVRGNVEGKKFVIRFSLGGVTSVYTGRVDGNKISGGVELSDGSEKLQGTFSGERTSAPPVARPRPVAPAPAPAPTPVAPAPAPTPVAPAPKPVAPTPAPVAVAPAPAPAPKPVASAPVAPKPAAADVDMTGKWQVTVITPRGPGNPDFILKQDGNRLTGDYKGLFGETSVRGNVEGKKFVIRFSLGGVTSVYTGRVDGDKMSGGVELSDGSEKLQGTFSGERN